MKEKKKSRLNGRGKDILLLCILATVLTFATWKLFYKDETVETSVISGTDEEKKVARILQEIDGVGKAEVMIYESEEGVESVVVVCEGANDLRVVMNVREAVATALGTEQKAVKIYQKK